MGVIGNSLVGIGVLASLIGIGGFIDTRKVDRRFKTGYKNNEPDSRNFGRSGKILLCGIGLFVFGLVVNRMSDSDVQATGNEVTHEGRAPADLPIADSAKPTTENVLSEVHASTRSASRVSKSERPSFEISEQSSGVSKAPADRAVQTPTFATGFDCSRASHDDETAVCHDRGLAAMDQRLTQLYAAALQTVSDPEALRQSELGWIATRHQCGKDLDCLRRVYGERIGQFVGSVGSKPLLPEDGK
ncbi:lysozyme inhibitor LprI family protein [Burkholderia contaminans]|uniref:lysozyme inhibitor LprI family protein n=1 Tax=Burkholderia contaminans TaxID=488447 RepID=UPI00158EC0E0|nr:lysozyme inhibitor LprI family protein [Burkholderia contaminans]